MMKRSEASCEAPLLVFPRIRCCWDPHWPAHEILLGQSTWKVKILTLVWSWLSNRISIFKVFDSNNRPLSCCQLSRLELAQGNGLYQSSLWRFDCTAIQCLKILRNVMLALRPPVLWFAKRVIIINSLIWYINKMIIKKVTPSSRNEKILSFFSRSVYFPFLVESLWWCKIRPQS